MLPLDARCVYALISKQVCKLSSVVSRNWQYKDVYRKTMNNQHHTCILEANYYLSVCNVHFKLALSSSE